MRFFAATLGAFSALSAIGVMAETYCIGTCMNKSRDTFATYGCSDADAAGCLCLKPNWLTDIKNCSLTDCQATADEVTALLKNEWCNSVPGFPVADAAASAPAATPSAPPTTSAAPAATQAPPTTSAAPQQTTQSAPAPAATETSPPASTSSPSASAESTAASSTNAAKSQASVNPSSTSAAPASQTSSSDAAASPGLSKAAIAGIGVGVGAAAVAAIGIALCFILKNRRRQNIRHSMQISKPLPGSGRTYPAGRRDNRPRGDSFEKYANEIEMQSNRYEDMLPRQQPRTMV